MKNLFAVALALLLASSLIGCGNGEKIAVEDNELPLIEEGSSVALDGNKTQAARLLSVDVKVLEIKNNNGEYIFYLNELDNLCQYEVCTNKISVLSDAIIADFKLTETGICFTSYMDGDTTYCYSLENRTIHILTGSTC